MKTANFRRWNGGGCGKTSHDTKRRDSTAAVVGAREIEAAPVENFAQIAQTKAGVSVGPTDPAF